MDSEALTVMVRSLHHIARSNLQEFHNMKQFLLLLTLAVVPALAQPDYYDYEPWRPTGSFGVGFSSPVNPLANRLNTGWNVAGGVGVTQNYFGVTVDAMLNDFGI